MPMPRLAGMPSDQPEAERVGPKAGLSPPCHSTTSSVGKIPSPIRGPYPLTGDASDVFDWILSLNQGEPQDLTTLLQMWREHYCGSLTFREQGNAIENLHQKSNEAAIDFLIRVGTSVSNLAKDWKDELTEC